MSKGFTLIEALIVSSIIVILSSVVVLGWREGRSRLALARSTNQLAQDIRRARDFAISAKEFGGKIPSGGYGIYIGSPDSSYRLYADKGNEKYDSSDEIVETRNLEKDIFIKEVSPSPLSINFRGPDPEVRISENATSAKIVLAIKSALDETKTIKVNKLGLIKIE